MAQPSAFDVWSTNQKAKGGTGNYGDQPVYGTTGYIGMDPSLYANLQSADQPMSPGANASYGNVAGTGAALSSMPTMVGGLAYDSDPYAQYKQQAAQQASGGFGSLTAGLSRDTGMMLPGQVSAGQYGSYAAPQQVNPHTQQQADAITRMVNQNLSQTVMPSIAASARANGSYGGSRQSIAEGLAAGNAATGLSKTLADLFSGNYQADVTNSLQQQQLNNSYGLGMGQLALSNRTADQNYGIARGQLALSNRTADQNYGIARGQLDQSGRQIDNNFALGMGSLQNNATAQNQSFYTANRAQDQQGMALAAGLYGQGIAGMAGMGQGVYGVGQAAQQQPWTTIANYGGVIAPFSGLGGGQVTTGSSSPVAGAVGGAVLGNQFANLWTGGNKAAAFPWATGTSGMGD